MKISTKGRYAIKLMLDLALYSKGQTMEGNLSPTDCVGANGWPCENKATCVSLIIWQKLDEAINGVLEGMTLEDLVEWQQNLWTDQYVI